MGSDSQIHCIGHTVMPLGMLTYRHRGLFSLYTRANKLWFFAYHSADKSDIHSPPKLHDSLSFTHALACMITAMSFCHLPKLSLILMYQIYWLVAAPALLAAHARPPPALFSDLAYRAFKGILFSVYRLDCTNTSNSTTLIIIKNVKNLFTFQLFHADSQEPFMFQGLAKSAVCTRKSVLIVSYY